MGTAWRRAKRALAANLCVYIPGNLDDDGGSPSGGRTAGRPSDVAVASSPTSSGGASDYRELMPKTPTPTSSGLRLHRSVSRSSKIIKVLEFIGKKENLQLPPGFAARIAAQSNRSLRRAILSLETCRVQQYPFTANQAVPPMDWEQYVSEIASDIIMEQSPKRLFLVRGKLYELLVNCIPPEIILKKLLSELLKKLDSELKHEVCHWAAYYEHRMCLGQKAIFHIEAFVAKFMSIYKGFLIATFS